MKTEDIELFHQVAESGSLSKVAAILALPKSNVSRRIQALEKQLQLSLFHRQNRSLELTVKGQFLYQKTKPLLNQLNLVLEEVTESSEELSGNVRVQVLPAAPTLEFQERLFKFMGLHPKVTVEIVMSGVHENIKEQQIDIALRVGEKLEDSSLVARQFWTTTLSYYASPDYLHQFSEPQKVDELVQHNVCRFRLPTGELSSELPRCGLGGTVNVSGNLIVNTSKTMKAMAIEGKAIAFLPDEEAKRDVDAGRLIKLFPQLPEFNGTAWLVYSTRQHLSATTRALLNFLLDDDLQ